MKIVLILVICGLGFSSCRQDNDFKLDGGDDVQPKQAGDVELNWCKKSDGNCTKNICEQSGKVCCWCDTYINSDSFGHTQPCFCCPKDHVCCSSSKPLQLNSTSNCCPPNSECSPDGNSCLRKIKPVASEALIEVCHDSVVKTGTKNTEVPFHGW